MDLILKRTYFENETIGVLYMVGKEDPIWFTMEKPWLDNEPFKSCIPEGKYTVVPYSSPKYPDVWEVTNVVDRSKILIHKGNWEHDLKGCIAVGLASGYIRYGDSLKKAVSSSGSALREMKNNIGYPNEFNLEVVS